LLFLKELFFLFFKGDFDVKDINLVDNEIIGSKEEDEEVVATTDSSLLTLTGSGLSTYQDLNDAQLKDIVDFLTRLDERLRLFDLDFNKLDNDFISQELVRKNDSHKKHMKQIASMVGHVDVLMESFIDDPDERVCLVELGSGRGRLSYWFDESRRNQQQQRPTKARVNILLVERGSQRLKFDSMIKKSLEEAGHGGELERIRIDLKDLYVNRLPLIERSSRFVLYGKHLCGCASDFSLRCLKHSLQEEGQAGVSKFAGLVLAVCCHHKCEWEALCGKEVLQSLGIDRKLFYIIRSISSWYTSGDRNIAHSEGTFFFQNQVQLRAYGHINLI
jgi:hypothetical protein